MGKEIWYIVRKDRLICVTLQFSIFWVFVFILSIMNNCPYFYIVNRTTWSVFLINLPHEDNFIKMRVVDRERRVMVIKKWVDDMKSTIIPKMQGKYNSQNSDECQEVRWKKL